MRMTSRTIAALTALALVAGVRAQDEKKKLEEGDAAPALVPKEMVQGSAPTLDAPGTCTLVEFWSVAIPDSDRAVPRINRLHRELGPQGLQVVAVSGEKKDDVAEWVRKRPSLAYPVAADDGGDTLSNWVKAAERGMPCVFLVGRGGRILWIGNPLDEQFEPTVRQALGGRFDPARRRELEPKLKAARSQADIGNWGEAYKHYDEAIEVDPGLAVDVTLERFRCTLRMQKDPKAASAWLVETARRRYGSDLDAVAQLLSAVLKDPELQPRDLEAAEAMAESVAGKSGPRVKEIRAMVAFAKGDVASAIDLQVEAWMESPPLEKASAMRTLQEYRSAAGRAAAKGGAGAG